MNLNFHKISKHQVLQSFFVIYLNPIIQKIMKIEDLKCVLDRQGYFLFKNNTNKGHLILKGNCLAVNLFFTNMRHVFVHFLEEIKDSTETS